LVPFNQQDAPDLLGAPETTDLQPKFVLDTDTKRRIDTARDILVGKVPDPKSQVEHLVG